MTHIRPGMRIQRTGPCDEFGGQDVKAGVTKKDTLIIEVTIDKRSHRSSSALSKEKKMNPQEPRVEILLEFLTCKSIRSLRKEELICCSIRKPLLLKPSLE